MKKRLIAMILALCILFPCIPFPGYAATNPFTDVKESDYFYDAVLWAVENGITSGTSANKFSPNMTCSRGQVVTFLWRSAGEPEPNSKVNPFSDVDSSDYFYDAVLWAVENGITSGTGNGRFSPNAPCTRGQVATFLWRAEGEPETAYGTNPFSDIRTSDFYYEAVLWAVENGITSGIGNGKFSPNSACSRGQIVSFLYRADGVTDDPESDYVASGTCGRNVTWTIESNGLLTISGSGAMYDYEDLEDLPWISYWDDVTEIVVEEGITAIGKQALAGFDLVTQISLPSTLKSIGTYAFADCISLTSIVIPSGVTTISDGAFGYCHALKSVTIPGTVQTLGIALFYQCYDLTNVTLSEGLTVLSGGMFAYCTSLKEITIPSSVTTLKASPFDGCTGLKSITFEGNAPSFASDSFKSVTATAYYPSDNSTWTSSVRQNYGGNITWFAKEANYGEFSWTLSDDGVLTVSGTGPLPDYEEPYHNTFPRSDVKSIIIMPGITSIGKNVFFDLRHVTSVSIPNTVTSIGHQAFYGCAPLTEVVIPNSVTSIGAYAFGVTAIQNIRIPASVTTIQQGAFAPCTQLTSIVVDDGNSKYYSDDGVLFSYDGWLMQVPAGRSGSYTVPSGITRLHHYAFSGCESISSVTLPKSLVNVGTRTFQNCTNLAEIYFTGNAPSFASDTFESVTATAYYPKNNSTWTSSVRQNYGGSITWTSYDDGSTEPNPDDIVNSGTCGNNATWTLTAGGTLTISGSGAMYDYDDLEDLPWVSYWDDVTKIVVAEGITAIGKQALAGFDLVTQISLPSTLKSIGIYAFVDCISLTSIVIPSGVTTISDGAFGYCHALKSVTIPGTVQTLGTALFYQCYDLTNVTLSEGLTLLSGGMFAYCTSLKEITIPASVTTLKASPFDGCTGLKSITFKGNAPSFASDSFKGVTATVHYPSGNSTWTSSVRQNYGGSITWVTNTPDVPEESYKELQRSDIEVYLIVPSLNDYNAYVQLEIYNYSDKPMTIPTYIGIGDKAVHQDDAYVLDPGYKVKIYFFRAPLKEDRYEEKYYDMYLTKNSTGYIVITWDTDQYYCEYGVDGIYEFYRGNVNGPATDPPGPNA